MRSHLKATDFKRPTARIERFVLAYHIDCPPSDPPNWAAWVDKTGAAVAFGRTSEECAWQCRWLGYEPRLWLRSGDDGKERAYPRVGWASALLKKLTGEKAA